MAANGHEKKKHFCEKCKVVDTDEIISSINSIGDLLCKRQSRHKKYVNENFKFNTTSLYNHQFLYKPKFGGISPANINYFDPNFEKNYHQSGDYKFNNEELITLFKQGFVRSIFISSLEHERSEVIKTELQIFLNSTKEKKWNDILNLGATYQKMKIVEEKLNKMENKNFDLLDPITQLTDFAIDLLVAIVNLNIFFKENDILERNIKLSYKNSIKTINEALKVCYEAYKIIYLGDYLKLSDEYKIPVETVKSIINEFNLCDKHKNSVDFGGFSDAHRIFEIANHDLKKTMTFFKIENKLMKRKYIKNPQNLVATEKLEDHKDDVLRILKDVEYDSKEAHRRFTIERQLIAQGYDREKVINIVRRGVKNYNDGELKVILEEDHGVKNDQVLLQEGYRLGIVDTIQKILPHEGEERIIRILDAHGDNIEETVNFLFENPNQ
jgi:hypothetical protein